MRFQPSLWPLAGLAALWLACPGNTGIGTGPAPGTTVPAPGSPAERKAPPEWVETICDRVEDCAVERNVQLARSYGGVPVDVSAARREARQALVSGAVRRWCLMRVKSLRIAQVKRVHGCLKRTSCGPFYQCADFPAAHTHSRRPATRAAAR